MNLLLGEWTPGRTELGIVLSLLCMGAMVVAPVVITIVFVVLLLKRKK